MKSNSRTMSLLVLLVSLAFVGGLTAQVEYVGSLECKECHEDIYNYHRVSGHPFKLNQASDMESWSVPLPEGYDWEDISYVIGGHTYKIRYMDTDGYIITEAPPGTPGNNQYNKATGEWVDYHAGEADLIYNCGSCHTTGFVAGDGMAGGDDGQDGLEGIDGTWEFPGIECEECHGPGDAHVAAPSSSNITLDDTALACGACHIRGDFENDIPASGGFVKHHEQYNELLASPHANLSCNDCHDPHKKSEFSIHTSCVDCHTGYADSKAAFKGLGKKHDDYGVSCVDCHMPYTGKSAVAFHQYKGDIRSHLFDISTDTDVEPFNEEGTSATGILTGEWVCYGCHTGILAKFEKADAKAEEKGKQLKSILYARKSTKKIHKPVSETF